MNSILRFDLYKARKSISTWIVLLCVVVFTVLSLIITYSTLQGETTDGALSMMQQLGEEIGVPYHNETIVDWCVDATSGDFLMMFVLVFAIIAVSGDFSSGYIKNVYGATKHKEFYVCSKFLLIAIFSMIAILVSYIVTIVFNVLLIGANSFGNVSDFLIYTVVKILLSVSFGTLVCTISIIAKRGLVSALISIGYAFMFANPLYSGINLAIQRITNTQNFDIAKYTLIGNTMLLNMNTSNNQLYIAITVSIVMILLSFLCGCMFFARRDI